MTQLFKGYKEGMQQLPTTPWSAVIEEWKEFINEPSLNELFDVIHGILRWSKVPAAVCFIVAYKTAAKHSRRYINHGCVRSKRNHDVLGTQCSCKKENHEFR